MTPKNYFNKFKRQIIEYNAYISCIEKLLKESAFEDKIHLFSIHKRLKEKLINLENILKKITSFDETNQKNIQVFSVKCFRKLKIEFVDFFILLRWNHFSSIYIKLHIICDEKLSIPHIERKSYKDLLNRLEDSIK